MKFSKILMAAIAVMMIFSIVPVASAGDGTEGDPFTVLYIGYRADTEFGMFMDMAAEGLSGVTSEITGNDVYYITDHAVIDYGEHFLPCQASIYAAAVKLYTDYDYLIIDMLFTGYSYDGGSLDGARDYLYTLADEADIPNKASIYSDDGFDSYAPESFGFRDQLAFSSQPPSEFAKNMDAGLNDIGYGSTLLDYRTLLSYLN